MDPELEEREPQLQKVTTRVDCGLNLAELAIRAPRITIEHSLYLQILPTSSDRLAE